MQRPLAVISGVGLAVALALWAWLPVDHGVVDVRSGKASAKPRLRSAGPSASLDWRTPTTPTTTPSVSVSTPPPSATPLFAVPITVAAPQKALVGETNDLVLSVGANAGVGEISFTVRFDANVLQVRAGLEGDWAMDPRLNTRFAAEISDKEDRVQIRSSVSGERTGIAGGSVAIVRFQAVAPGTTSVLITDVMVKDLTGRWIASAVSASNLPMTVYSVPPQAEAWRQRGAVAVEPPTETAEDGD